MLKFSNYIFHKIHIIHSSNILNLYVLGYLEYDLGHHFQFNIRLPI